MFLVVSIISIFMIFSTLAGGFIALRVKKYLHLLLGLVAGLMLGVVAFDLFPEIFELAKETEIDIYVPMISFVVGFLGFHIIEKLVVLHSAHENKYKSHSHRHIGKLSASALIIHRFLDGLSIGLAFQINTYLAMAVSIVIIAHSFIDGLNISGFLLRYKNTKTITQLFILIGAFVPVLGLALAGIIKLPKWSLLVYMSLFAGLLLYISTADILPEAHNNSSSKIVLVLTILGIMISFTISLLVNNL